MNRLRVLLFKNHTRNYHSHRGIYGFRVQSILNNDNSSLPTNYSNKVYQVTEAFRNNGYRIANLNPLGESKNIYLSSLDPLNYGLESNERISLSGILHSNETETNSEDFFLMLKRIYCDKIGIEFQHIHENEKEWLAREFEKLQLEHTMSCQEKKNLINELIKSQVFDNFLATKFATVKRYGGEGAESMIAFFLEVFHQSCIEGLNDVIIGIPHRGRLNLLTGLLDFPPVVIFKKYVSMWLPVLRLTPLLSNDLSDTYKKWVKVNLWIKKSPSDMFRQTDATSGPKRRPEVGTETGFKWTYK